MLPELVFEITSYLLNLIVALFVIYYLIRLRKKEKELEKKEAETDTNYHKVVDDALSKERKILTDATEEAQEIITNAQYINKSSQATVDHALSKMMQDIQSDAVTSAHDFKTSYQTSLQQVATTSISEFQQVIRELQSDLHKQIQEFHNTLLPGLQKELDAYKQSRMKQAEMTITRVVQEVSQDILNKSISFEDHQKLMLESLDKAKKEGLFE